MNKHHETHAKSCCDPGAVLKVNAFKVIKYLALASVMVVATGCSGSKPRLKLDTGVFADTYRQQSSASTTELDVATWSRFNDPQLSQLIEKAKLNNIDVAIARQRVLMARAGSQAVSARLAPEITLTASSSEQKTDFTDAVKQGIPDTRSVRAGVEIGFEVDIFGSAKSGAKAADYDALAADENVLVAQWLASTEVAQQYFIWQGARLRVKQVESLISIAKQSEGLTKQLADHGLASQFDVARKTANTNKLASQITPLKVLVSTSEAKINVLLGKSPTIQMDDLTEAVVAAIPSVPTMKPGQPIDLLKRRPDLRIAEAKLMAATARLKQSRADLWPKFYISTIFGTQDIELNTQSLPSANFSNVVVAFAAPIFNAGRLRAMVNIQSAREQEALLKYELTALKALQDVESALVLKQGAYERLGVLTASAKNWHDSLKHAEALHQEGQINTGDLLDAQRALVAAEISRTEAEIDYALSAVQLIRALGGGWQADIEI